MENPLYEQIFNFILQKINDGELKQGERVPSEKELAAHFNVSRITSKKALEMLSQYKLIERIQGKGSFVAEVLPDLQETKLQKQTEDVEVKPESDEVRIVGVVLPDFGDSFGADLIRGIEEQCSISGCVMMMKLTYDNREVEETAIREFVKLGVNGIIVFPGHGQHYNSEVLRLVLDGFPIVLVDRYLKGIAASAVYTDNRKATYDLTNLLLKQEGRNVGFLSTPADSTTTIEDRLMGFNDAFIQAGISPKPEHIMTNLYSSLPQSFETIKVQYDIETVRHFVDINKDLNAYVVSEYNLALILREVLLSLEKRIPEDYQIVCFDSPSEPFGDYLFTHVRQNERETGRKAVELLLRVWNNEVTELNNIVEHEIVQGKSTFTI